MNTPKMFWLCLFLSICSLAQAQHKLTLKGTIVSDENKKLPGITVSMITQSGKQRMKSNENGEFTFEKIQDTSIELLFSSSSHKRKVLQIQHLQHDTTVLISLSEKLNELDGVDVLGTKSKYTSDTISKSLRLQTPILEIPQNIQVISKEITKQQQIFNILDGLSRNVSGIIRTTHWENYANLKMRGGQINAFRDGMNVSMPWGPLAEDMSNVESVEVIKGPANFLSSSGDAAGSYNIVTKKPTGTTQNRVQLSAGSYNLYRLQGDFDGKINKKLWYRLALGGQYNNTFRAYQYAKRITLSPSLRYQVAKNTGVTLQYIYNFNQTSLTGAEYLFSEKGYKNLPQNFTFAPKNTPPSNINDQSINLFFDHKISTNWQLNVNASSMRYSFLGTSIWLDSLKDNGDAYRYLGRWDALGRNQVAQAYVNGKVTTGEILHKITSGIDWGKKTYIAQFGPYISIDTEQPFNVYQPTEKSVNSNFYSGFDFSKPLSERAGWRNNQQYTALYAQDEMGFLKNKLRLTLGGRYTFLTQEDQSKTILNQNKFSPRIGINANITPSTTIYSLYDQAFSAQFGQTFNNGNPKQVAPLISNNIELGMKNNFMGGKWNSSLSVYQIDRKNITTADVLNSTSGASYVIALGETRTRGAELDIKGEILPNLNVMINYAYTISTIKKNADKKMIGKLVPGFATHVQNTWVSYKFSKGMLQNFGINAGYQLQAKRVPLGINSYKVQGLEQLPNYFKIDGGIFYEKNQWDLQLNVNNVLNSYIIDGAPAGYSGIKYYYQAEAPRNFRLSVGYKF